MNRFLLILIITMPSFIMAQIFNYEQKWKELNSSYKEGNVKSLIPKINEIYSQAKKENNTEEIVNALIFHSQLISETKEDNNNEPYELAIQNFEIEITHFKGVTLSVMQSLLANMYSEYQQRTQWDRHDITVLQQGNKDISTWTSGQLTDKSLNLYKESIKNAALLKNAASKKWVKILTSKEDLDLRPTLYDILVHRYVDALRTNDNIEDKKNIQSLTAELLEFHKNDKDKTAYLSLKLEEINDSDKSPEVKSEEILQLAGDYKNEPFSAYLYYIAAQNINSTNKAQAFKICKNVVFSKENPWSVNCKNLIEKLQQSQLTITLDEVILPNENIAIGLNTTNIDKLYYKIYEVNPSEVSNITEKNSQIINNKIYSNNKKILKSGEIALKHFDDYSSHSTIARLEGFPSGNYLIEFANTSDFKTQLNNKDYLLGSGYFTVSDWTIVSLNDDNSYQLLNRKTGKILTNQTLQVYKRLNYSDKNPRIFSDALTVKTDKNGIFMIPVNNITSYYNFYVYDPNSKSYTPLSISYYKNRHEEEKEIKTAVFFTDRAIYRPGQKVYFKSILYKKNNEKSAIIKNKNVEIELINPNGEKVTSLSLITNDYGSVFGEFILPQGGLTGQYSISTEFGNIYISVEEYKRPKFEVTIDKPVGEYVLDKDLKIQGKAVSYAGAPISEAKVVYRVERQEIFPFFRGWFPPRRTTPETIAQGEILTNGEGKFEIPFTAKSKEPKKDKEYRTYTYVVYVDVTDINGETQTSQTDVTIGDLPKKLTLNVPDRLTSKEFTKVGITSSNLNEVKEPSKGKIIITKLESPKKIVLPNKVNSVPDYQLYNESEFNKYFPYFPYSKEEQNPQFWKKGKSETFNFDTEKSDSIKISNQKRGYYLVEAFTMYGNDSIKTQKIIEVTDNKTFKSVDNLFFDVSTVKTSYKVGENVELNFLSDLKEATAILHIESGNKWIEHKQISIKDGKATFTIPVKQEFLKDGLFISAYLVKENGYSQKNIQITIADKPRDLKITTKVFRDKLLPGGKETWELTISGNDKEKITAEVLAAMYDASLDQFQSNSYTFNPWEYYPNGSLYYQLQTHGYGNNSIYFNIYNDYLKYKTPVFTDLKDFELYSRRGNVLLGYARKEYMAEAVMSPAPMKGSAIREKQNMNESLDMAGVGSVQTDENKQKPSKIEKELAKVQVRTNLQETAFFYPNLYTDKDGNVKLTFTTPEALTKWKLLILAHTQDLQSGTAEFYTQTQKDLMVVPNVPRFLREGDQITLSTKINNLSGKNLAGNAQLQLFDALTNKPVDFDFQNNQSIIPFNTEAGKNSEVSWTLKVPKNTQAVNYKIVAKAGNFSDGEESILPILTNRILVTETLPISIKENQTKEYRFDKLINNKSNSLQNFNLSMELTANPTWLAVFSLPYLREYPYECSEQLFSRLYGNILSTHIINSNPKIKNVFDNWNVQNLNISSLEKNQELKNILLEETPWVRNAQSENEQKKRIALLFDLNKMSNENVQAQDKLIKRQNQDGGFSWFEGGYSSPYITERVILGFGQLKNMLGDKFSDYMNENISMVIKNAIEFEDAQTVKYIKDQQRSKMKVDGKALIHYYYVRSFWKENYKLPAEVTKYLADINKDISTYFRTYDLQNKAMAAIVLNRYGYQKSAQTIIHNMKETAVESDEMGMYWKDNKPGWNWYQTPVESQTRAIEAFAEVTPKEVQSIEEMKVWLLKNRQTNAWNSTKATTDAVYALMNFGKDWSNAEEGVKVFAGNEQFYPSQKETTEQASGYIKQSWRGEEITPEKGIIKVEKTSPGVAWGGLYWQYFEDLDKTTQADANIKMQKQLFLKVNTDKGQQLQEITETQSIKTGDLVTIRLVIKVDRDMEYIQIKDMRASGFEPINVLSGYKYQNGSGYYESTRDAATNFFFEKLRKGTYVFEYDVRANNKGEFSNGITQLQSMYAPEMSAHSEGIRVKIQ